MPATIATRESLGIRLAAAVLLAAIVGCGQSDTAPTSATSPAVAGNTGESQRPLPEGETWDAIYMGGSPLGYVRTTTRYAEYNGQKVVEVEAQQQMTVQRFGSQTAPGATFKSIEALDGRLLRFESQQQIGPTSQSAEGTVQDGQLIISTKSTGQVHTTRIPWSDSYRSFFALEHSLARQPMQPGEKRSIQALAPLFNQLATYEFTADKLEETKLLDGTRSLLRVNVVTRFPNGNTINSIVWVDQQGQVMKTRTDAFSWETFRTTKEKALASDGAAGPDLGLATMVRLERPLNDAHRLRRVRYEMSLSGSGDNADPTRLFSSDARQQVRSLGPQSAELIITAPLEGSGPQAPSERPPSEADLKPNNFIQSDHPLVVQMAQEAGGDLQDTAQLARALEKYVHANVRNKTFTQALATAADVAQTREGDCTEHAVLLAALARARGIPARVAIGLVYVESLQGFGYHMWNELYVNGSWLGLDGTLGQGGIGPAHIKVADTSLAGGDALAAFLPVAQLSGRLKIKVLEAE